MQKKKNNSTKNNLANVSASAPQLKVGILCKPGGQAISYVNYLQKKEIEVKLYPKLELGIKGALTDQIRFLFVDLDIPESKVNQFVISAGKVLPLYIIPFTNGAHSKMRSIEPHLKTPYCIYPPTTPSGIHRMIVRIQLEEERAKTVGHGDVFLKSSTLSTNSSDLIRIEDRKKLEEKLIMIFKNESSKTHQLEGVVENNAPEFENSLETETSNQDLEIKLTEFEVKNQNIKKLQTHSELSESDRALISRATEDALQKTFGIANKEELSSSSVLKKIDSVQCFTVNTQRFKGYMLYAHSGIDKGHRALLQLVRQRLAAYLKENGETLNQEEEVLDLKVIEVDLEPWAFEKAEFLVKSSNVKEEVAMAFIPRQDVETHLEESTKQEMLKFKLKELKPNTKLELDAFIYMPVNEKYVRYHKQGNIFEQRQKERLEQKGVNELHIKKEATSDIQKYRAVVFLDEKIADYKNQIKTNSST